MAFLVTNPSLPPTGATRQHRYVREKGPVYAENIKTLHDITKYGKNDLIVSMCPQRGIAGTP